MTNQTSTTPPAENPDAGGDRAPAGAPTPSSGVENPDVGSASVEALRLEAGNSARSFPRPACRAICSRSAMQSRRRCSPPPASIETLSDAPSTQGIVGVGIGLPDPDSIAFGVGGPGEPTLTLFTESALPQELLLSQLAQSAGTRALSSVPVQQVPVGRLTPIRTARGTAPRRAASRSGMSTSRRGRSAAARSV